MEEGVWHHASQEETPPTVLWEIDEEIVEEATMPLCREMHTEVEEMDVDESASERPAVDRWSVISSQVASAASALFQEGSSQYRSSAKGAAAVLQEAQTSATKTLRSVWNFLTQPVWVPGRASAPKQYHRGALFLLDTLAYPLAYEGVAEGGRTQGSYAGPALARRAS